MILFIGLGRMGLPMAVHALKAGQAVVGCDPSESRRVLLIEQGGTACDEPSTFLQEAKAVVIMVGAEAQVEQIVTGPGGLVERCRPGTLVLVVSTVAPDLVARLGEATAAHGLRLVDAPVCRAEMGAIAGNLLAFLSGPESDCREAAVLMRPYSADIEIVGERLGAAQIAKTVNNMILWACAMANEEGLRLAADWQLDQGALRRALMTSSANNWALQNWDNAKKMVWSIKDMEIALRTAQKSAVAVPLAETVEQLVRKSSVLAHA
ncbi:NAD(P)-dependent oxidoreductase [Bradyrhizobium sp. LHD-71]|uniref:NAD(P)-dependent oxidoreductase n=1 Tax=Bradyrhizobium sp. LHD-71 TaxID=3072141 RepID=UPI00280D82CD|nr:NAD(P)-dependent oxidoreductase [Bradyrhizobium sp. LHD-71]MDQ8732431.1 NAD(P)-dependent oxidoreductase [Bradyrhizobium sp. LHD-71]